MYTTEVHWYCMLAYALKGNHQYLVLPQCRLLCLEVNTGTEGHNMNSIPSGTPNAE